MYLKLARSQKVKGMMSKTVVFVLDARVEYTSEEQQRIKAYGLDKQVIYNSSAAAERIEKGRAALESGTAGGLLSATMSLAMSKLSLNVTIGSLAEGHHIETESLTEILDAEEAIIKGCENVKSFIELAATFDGTERVLEI